MFNAYLRALSVNKKGIPGHKKLYSCIFLIIWTLLPYISLCSEDHSDEIISNAMKNVTLSDSPELIKASKVEETRPHATWLFVPQNKITMSSSTQKKTVQKVPKRREESPPQSWDTDRIVDEEEGSPDGTSKTPGCAQYGRYYCTYKEDYPSEVVNQVIKYMKTPLEKLFRDLRGQKMPRIADNADGSLVCDSITRIVRPGWAKNNNARWVVVINTEAYQQHVTEVVCRYDNSFCNFVPPCYQASCQQRYNIQIFLVIDPYNPYRGPFLSKFLFPSCCVCYVPKFGPEKNQDDF